MSELRPCAGNCDLVEKYLDLLALFADELTELVPLVLSHGWKSSRVEQGKKLRKEINELWNTQTKSDPRHELEICQRCNGDGYTPEHDPDDPHENGCSNCPVQAQCDTCHATGLVWKKDIESVSQIEENDLPF